LEDLEVMKTNTAKKMLTIFRQLEENAAKEDIPDGRELRTLQNICSVTLHNICSVHDITLPLQMRDLNYFETMKL